MSTCGCLELSPLLPLENALSFMVVFMVQLVQEYVCSCFLHTNNFSLYLYIRCLPTFQMGLLLSGFLPLNLSILKFSSVLHTKVQSDKLSNYIYKSLSCQTSDSPHFHEFQIT